MALRTRALTDEVTQIARGPGRFLFRDTISYIVPTIGRPSLSRTLASIRLIPMMLVPHVPHMLNRAGFGTRRYGDYDFLSQSRWRRREFLWREEIIADLGHD